MQGEQPITFDSLISCACVNVDDSVSEFSVQPERSAGLEIIAIHTK